MESPDESQSWSNDFKVIKRMDRSYASKIYGKFQYRWTSHREYIVTVMCFMLSPDIFTVFARRQNSADPDFVQHLLVYIFFALPMYYMQVFIGQYTQNSIFFIKYMIPLASGVAHAYMITIAFQLVIIGLLLTDNIMYLLLTMQVDMPWLNCQNDINISCVTKSSKSNATASSYTSAYIYWRYVYMGGPAMDVDKVKIGVSSLQRFISLNVAWFIIFIFMTFAYKRRQLVLNIFFGLFCICMVVLNLRIIVAPGTTSGITKLMMMNVSDFVNLKTWMTTLSFATWQLTLGQAIHILSGARMEPTDSSGFLCLACTMLVFVFCVSGAIVTHGTTAIAELNTNLVLFDDRYFRPDIDALKWFVLIPQGLGYLEAPHVWTFLYFFGCCCLLVVNSITHIITIQLNITNAFPFMFQYRVYLLALYCLVGIVLGAGLLPKGQYALTGHVIDNSMVYIEVVAACLMSVTVFWIYGVTKLSDDIHFITGHQPTMFWKICWYISPVLLMVVSAYYTYFAFTLPYLFRLFNIIPIGVLIGPVLVVMIFNIFVYLKKRRLIGLLQPELEWGPMEPGERQIRLTCNPRTEVRSKSRRPICHHKCILNSKVLTMIIAKEDTKRQEIKEKFIVMDEV